MSTISIRLDREDKLYYGGEVATGVVRINTHHPQMAHQGVMLTVEGIIRRSTKVEDVGLFDDSVQNVRSLLIHNEIEVLSEGKISQGVTDIPFKFPVEAKRNKKLIESYHGVYVDITYKLVATCHRSLLRGDLSCEEEFNVEVPTEEVDLKKDSAYEFTLSPHTLDNVDNATRMKLDDWLIFGKVDRTFCDISQPFTGEINVEMCDLEIRSIEVQLIRMEEVASEVQNIQIGHGDVCRGLPIPIYMIFPRRFTCPSIVLEGFSIQFEARIIVLFKNGYMITERIPLRLHRV